MSAETVPIIEVKGSALERGRQQGEGARPQVHHALSRYREVIPKSMQMPWEKALREARKFLPYAEGTFPEYIDELRGLAEGAGAPFEEVWVLNCYEGLTATRHQAWGCTSFAVRGDLTANGHVLVGHNEDWFSVDRGNVYLVRAHPDQGPSFIGMTYGPLLVNIGFNADGIGIAIDSVYPTDGRVGVPRILCSRAVLHAPTIGEAILACVPKMRAGGYAYLLADPNGELYCVETSATTHDMLYGEEGWLVHTNHYLSSWMIKLEQPGPFATSNVRLNRARRLVKAQLGQASPHSLQAILRDHVNYPNGICSHEDQRDPPHEREQTLVSLIMDLTERVMWAAPGPPCVGEYHPYRLDA